MQIRFMTWSAYLKGLCDTSRYFHQTREKKKKSFCRKMRFQGKKFNADVEAVCPSGVSAVTLI